MRLFRHRRWIATLLLLISSWSVAFSATPLAASHCECAHGPEVDCDCPHHPAAAAPDDASLPPCHRAMKRATHRSAPSPASSFRAKCGSSQPVLLLVTLLQLEPSAARFEPAFEQEPVPGVHAMEVTRAPSPLRRPPRS